ncbi:hypothetical protein [Acetatifactor aquisgranensis]|uniref:hypothetical protein n=1 Tax=Acetatifactor aquisgranensis TaxID=2941233 RepID=UPI00203AEA00|nr:hypothetical protein [Acetatifactor aquisgranensis]
MKRVFSSVFVGIVAFTLGKILGKICLANKLSLLDEKYTKNQCIINTFDLWLQQKQDNHQIQDFFLRNGFREIAIYGMHYLGEHLLRDLRETEITVKYAIDKNADKIACGVKVIPPDAELEKVDAIIVTAIYYFDDIEKQLASKIDCPIISLDDVLGNL